MGSSDNRNGTGRFKLLELDVDAGQAPAVRLTGMNWIVKHKVALGLIGGLLMGGFSAGWVAWERTAGAALELKGEIKSQAARIEGEVAKVAGVERRVDRLEAAQAAQFQRLEKRLDWLVESMVAVSRGRAVSPPTENPQ